MKATLYKEYTAFVLTEDDIKDIKVWCVLHDMNQVGLAEYLGITPTQVTRIFKQEHFMNEDVHNKLMAMLESLHKDSND